MKDQVLTLGNENSILETENKILLDGPAKGKSHASEIWRNLENELKRLKINLCSEHEKNRLFKENLDKTKYERERTLKWNRFSEMLTTLHENYIINRI